MDVVEGIEIVSRISEIDALHLQELLRRRLDALETSGFGEGKLEIGGGQLEVMLRLGELLDEVGHLATVVHELAVRTPSGTLLVVDDVRANILDEWDVMRYDEDRGVGKLLEVLGEPFDGLVVQMVGWLIEQEDVGIDQNSSGQTKLHLPTTRKLADGTLHHLVRELVLVEHGLAIGLGFAGGRKQVLEDVLGLMDRVDVGTRIDVLGLEMGRPSLELAIVDGIHQRGLTHTVLRMKAA